MAYNYDFDIAAIMIYGVLFWQYFKRKRVDDNQHRVYAALLLCAFFVPVSDILSAELIDRSAAYFPTVTVTIIYYLARETSIFLYLLLVLTQLEFSGSVPKIRKFFLLVPIFLFTLAILTTPLTGWMFSYQDRIYQSGPLRLFNYLVTIIYYIWALIYVLKNSRYYDRALSILVIVTSGFNMVVLLVQYFFPYVLLQSFAFTISLFLIYLVRKDYYNVFDSVTGMGNSSLLSESVNKFLFNEVPFHSIMIRIGDYDLLTTTYGLSSAESMMKNIAKYLQSFANPGYAFSLSSSFYVLNIPESQTDDIGALVAKIYSGLDRLWEINSVNVPVSFLITVINSPKEVKSMGDYMAYLQYFQKMKRMRYGLVPVDELELHDRVREQTVEASIENGLQNDLFSVFYQPICTTREQNFVTAEALVRLQDPKEGFISPGEFIPLAETTGAIIHIGKIVLEKVCLFISTHDMEALGLEYIEVNLSVVQCLQRDFIETLDLITAKYQVDSHYLCFEITETASNCAPAIFTENLEALRSRGYKLALDDFGSGYGNLQRMVTNSFDVIKFDKEMTEQLCGEKGMQHVFNTMQHMFHAMDSTVVAEGVETADQYRFLLEAGCDYIQGYYFSRPLPEEDFLQFILTHRK